MNRTSREDLDLFAAEVLSRLGFRLDEHNFEQIDQVLRQRLEYSGARTVDAYVRRFKAEPGFRQEEWRAIVSAVTVPETYFSRHPEQFQALAAVLPSGLKAHAAGRRLSILSAGCASGEEAYSIAATILKTPGIGAGDVSIRAVDVNGGLLEQARRARYSPWALRALDEVERTRLFHQEGNSYALNDPIRNMVQFEEHNLLEEAFWQENAFDLIFCRNVMIYFTPQAIRSLTAMWARSLVPGGFLFLGPSETLRGISHEFHLRHTHGAFYYQRRLPGEKPTQSLPVQLSLAPWPAPELLLRENDTGWMSAIAGSAQRIATLASRSRPAPSSTCPEPGPVFPARQDLDEVRELLSQERFQDALQALEALPGEVASDPDALMVQAVLLANSGEVVKAKEVCERLLAHDELRPGAHYLLAVCSEKGGEPLAAAEHDQTAIYLDLKFAMPRLHLGLLARRLGDLGTARRQLGEAVSLLAREDAARILLFGGGFSRAALIQFGQAQLALCGGAR